MSDHVRPEDSVPDLAARERQLRAEYRAAWARIRMSEAFRVRPRQLTHGRPASLGLLLLWVALLAGLTLFLVQQSLRALGDAGPDADNLFAEALPAILVVLTWVGICLATLGVFRKHLRLREASAHHRQSLARALADLRREHGG